MSRRKKPIYTDVPIVDVAAEGKAIARIEDVVVFVSGPVPGDVVDLQITRKRKNFKEARVLEYKKMSELRVEPFCSHFGTCGGCKWQHLPYQEQLNFKEQQVHETLKRIGHLEVEQMEPILGSEHTQDYRNKLEYTFSNHRWLSEEEAKSDIELPHRNGIGFHVPGRFDRIVDVETCYLQAEPTNKLRNAARDFALERDLSFYDHKSNEGLLRNLIVRTTSTGEVMVILSVQHDEPPVYDLLDHLYKTVPEITSLMYVINPKLNETLYDQEIKVWKGKDHIIELMDGLKFKIGPKSFFQTNTQQGVKLYQKAAEYAGLTGNELVYDLYTGTGTIANFMARNASKVIGIESVPEAIEDARVNSTLNGIDNTEFFSGDMKELFSMEFIAEHGSPDVVITDPPRAGMHADVVARLLEIAPKRIVYISCNPATQARDLQLLSEKYSVKMGQPVDMFPHTHHIENIVQLDVK